MRKSIDPNSSKTKCHLLSARQRRQVRGGARGRGGGRALRPDAGPSGRGDHLRQGALPQQASHVRSLRRTR